MEYTDPEGVKRSLMPYSGALPGYFHIGQDVKVGRIGMQYFILDRWYVWQEHVVVVPLFGVWMLVATGYYLYWRPRMIAKERKEEASRMPQPTPGDMVDSHR